MLTITITGETPEDVKSQLQAFDKALTPGAKAAKSADKEPEEKANKKKAVEEVEEKAATHEDARGAIVALATKLGWDPAPPKIQAFTKKFAKAHDLTETVDGEEVLISRIPQIPVKKLKAFLQAVKDEADI